MIEYLLSKKLHFEGGQIRHCITEWEGITSDRNMLEMVEGTRVELIAEPEHSFKYQTHNHIPLEQITRVNDEIAKLASYKVIRKTTPEQGEFVSGFFAREKKDGFLRVILNLKSLNNYVLYKKFKMETFNKALTLITLNCYMASIDIYGAYFTVPIASHDQKFLDLNGKMICSNLPVTRMVCPRHQEISPN